MKVEIDNKLVERVNKIFPKNYDWDGTDKEWSKYVEALIEDDFEEI